MTETETGRQRVRETETDTGGQRVTETERIRTGVLTLAA